MEFRITRSLEEGPDYAPDWRHQTVQAYLVEVAASEDPRAKLQEICWAEADGFIRQYLKYKFDGRSVAGPAFRYAVGCQSRNAETGAASMIRSMILADRSPEEIAIELGTQTRNIVAFGKLFFDVRRFLGNESFLRRLVFSDLNKNMTAAEALRERRWLAAAFHRGWSGIEQVVLHRVAGTATDLENLSLQLQSILTSRALEFAAGLETSGTAPTESDLQRFLALQNMQSRQPPKQRDERKTMSQFIAAIHADIVGNADEHSDPKLIALKELKKTTAVAPQATRLRRRFAES